MKIRCDNADNGCEWIDELRLLDKHMTACNYTFLPCPNECEDGDKILRKDMERHKTEECPRRKYACPHCDEIGEYKERTTTHLEKCPLKEISCTNDGCSEHFPRRKTFRHLLVCEFQMVSCKYSSLGCKMKVLRKDLEKHECDRDQHLDFVVNAVMEHEDNLPDLQQQITEQHETINTIQDDIVRIDDSIDQQNSTLETLCVKEKNMLARLQSIILAQSRELSKLKSTLERLAHVPSYDPRREHMLHVQQSTFNSISSQEPNAFRFIEYVKRKSCNASVFSPPIYSSPGGYKMCIKVVPNGDGKGKGSHVSVYAYLMRGENDDHLPWPFTGTIVMELLNQLADQKHHTMSTKLAEGSNKRAVGCDIVNSGYGYPCYIPHSSLDYNAVTICQYLKDDCLYFRVKINSVVMPKPWLSSADVF